jgi:hypothetical protein
MAATGYLLKTINLLQSLYQKYIRNNHIMWPYMKSKPFQNTYLNALYLRTTETNMSILHMLPTGQTLNIIREIMNVQHNIIEVIKEKR